MQQNLEIYIYNGAYIYSRLLLLFYVCQFPNYSQIRSTNVYNLLYNTTSGTQMRWFSITIVSMPQKSDEFHENRLSLQI